MKENKVSGLEIVNRLDKQQSAILPQPAPTVENRALELSKKKATSTVARHSYGAEGRNCKIIN